MIKGTNWVGSSKRDCAEFPKAARGDLGRQLWDVQLGNTPAGSKSFPTVPGVRELCANHVAGGWFRLVYTVVGDEIAVLHVFQKKTNQTSKQDIEVIKRRLRELQAAKERVNR